MLGLFFLATLTALATGLGALPVYWLGDRAAALRPVMWGVVIGVMGVASVQGLLLPALREGDDMPVIVGLVVGVVFLLAARAMLGEHDVHLGSSSKSSRRTVLVLLVLFVHSLPEGLALGSAWASETVGLGAFVFIAIAVQNIPEGTAAAIPMRQDGVGPARAFWAAT